MGVERHHAILVTGVREDVATARLKAIDMELIASGLVWSFQNWFTSFFVAPDGSREGWEVSKDFDKKRARFVEWLASEENYGISWCEVAYGGDNDRAYVVNDVSIVDERK